MKLATLKNGSQDGRLVVVSRDLSRAAFVDAIASSMIEALEHWDEVESSLQTVYEELNAGSLKNSFPFEVEKAAAPLPRCYQFIDASAFLNHGNIMEEAFKLTVEKTPGVPILIQRQSDDFRGPTADFEFIDEADDADFEGEFAVITGHVPMGASAEDALKQIKLITILNDVSMRAHLFREKKMGFGFILAKPATVFAPVCVTPDELGDSWRDGRVHLDLYVHRNGELFGHPNGGSMDFGFDDILSHICYNRVLRPGMILGSGTVSNENHKEVGSACLAERRALDILEHGEPREPYLRFGEQLSFEVFDSEGRSIFGQIKHKMVSA
jgi:fumarylacetoacetate (FAA) hydrolase